MVTRELTDLLRMSNSINKVQLAKQILEEKRKSANDNIINPPSELLSFAPFNKVTQREVFDFIKERAKLTKSKGVGIRTIQTYWNYDIVDIQEIERIENERLEITYIPKEEQIESLEDVPHVVTTTEHSGVLDTQIHDQIEKAAEGELGSILTPNEQRYIDELDELARKSKEIEEEQERCRQYNLNTSNRDKRWW